MPDRRRTRTPTPPPTDAAAPQPVWTPEQVRALGVTTDVVTAGQILGLSRTSAYRLARADTFPCRSCAPAPSTAYRSPHSSPPWASTPNGTPPHPPNNTEGVQR